MGSNESLRSLARRGGLARPADDPAALRRYLAATLRQLSETRRGGLQAGREAARPACGTTATKTPPQRIERSLVASPVPFAFAAWIDHLFFLDALLDPALGGMHATELLPEERRGLELLRQAREEFWRRHELCPGCGALLIRGGTCLPCSLLASTRGAPRKQLSSTSGKP